MRAKEKAPECASDTSKGKGFEGSVKPQCHYITNLGR